MADKKGPQSDLPVVKRGSGFRLPLFRKRAAVYVDGFNLYHALAHLDRPHLKWLDLMGLAKALVPKDEVVKRVVWCTAFRPNSRTKLKNHKAYYDALLARGVVCRLGHFVTAQDGCNACGHSWVMSMEKQGDVNFALSVAADAEDDLFDVCYLITADGDHAATARYLKQRFPKKKVVCVAPPGRYPNRFILEWSDAKAYIDMPMLESSLLPASLHKRGIRVERPLTYTPPVVNVKKGHLKLVVNNG